MEEVTLNFYETSDYREGPRLFISNPENPLDEDEEELEDNEKLDITLKINGIDWFVYLLIVGIGEYETIFLRKFNNIIDAQRFCEKQFTLLHDIAPFRHNSEYTGFYHPTGFRESNIQIEEGDKLAWNQDLLDDTDHLWLIVIKNPDMIETYSLDVNSVWK